MRRIAPLLVVCGLAACDSPAGSDSGVPIGADAFALDAPGLDAPGRSRARRAATWSIASDANALVRRFAVGAGGSDSTVAPEGDRITVTLGSMPTVIELP